jgi:hypothetical protein
MKLTNFPHVYYITLEDSVNRQNYMEKQLNFLGVKNYTKILAFDGRIHNYCEDQNVTGKFKHQLNSGQIATTLSHLKAISEWYYHSDTPMAVFLEDDMNLNICQYWNFTWDDIISRLNKQEWNCIQLSLQRCNDAEVPLDEEDIRLRRRSFYNWSAGSYILKRQYAEKILNYYIDENNKVNLTVYECEDYIPYIENIIYIAGRPNEFTLPLFVEDVSHASTFYPAFAENTHIQCQIDSSEFVHNWWKNNGNSVNVDELLTPKNTRYWS